MFCSKCGAQLPDGSKFCEKCGTPVNRGVLPETLEPQKGKKPKGKIWLGIVIAVIVLALGIGVFAYYDMKILPEKIADEVGDMTLDGYEIPIDVAMNTFFDRQSGNTYEWIIDELGGRYYITVEGEVHADEYAFNFWYKRSDNKNLTYVELSSVTVNGNKLDKDSDDYSDFLDQVFGAIVKKSDESDVDEVADANTETEPDEEDEPEDEPEEELEEDVLSEQEEADQQENDDSSADAAAVIATEEYIYYDGLSDYSIIMYDTSDFEGTFALHMEESDDETGATTYVDYKGTFEQDISSTGIVDGSLYITSLGETLDYRIYYVDDHYEFELYDTDGEYFITLYEKEWSSHHAG